MRERRGRCKYLLHLQPSNYGLVEPFYPSFGHIGRSYHTKISKSLQQPMKGSTSLPSRTPLQIASPIWYSTGQSPPVFPNGADLVASCTTKRSSGSWMVFPPTSATTIPMNSLIMTDAPYLCRCHVGHYFLSTITHYFIIYGYPISISHWILIGYFLHWVWTWISIWKK